MDPLPLLGFYIAGAATASILSYGRGARQGVVDGKDDSLGDAEVLSKFLKNISSEFQDLKGCKTFQEFHGVLANYKQYGGKGSFKNGFKACLDALGDVIKGDDNQRIIENFKINYADSK